MEPHILSISEIIDSERSGYLSAEKQFHPTFSSFWAKLSYEKLFLALSEISGLLGDKFATHDQYFRHNRDNLPLTLQMHLSKIPNISHCFFIAFFGIYIKSWAFSKKKKKASYLLTLKDVVIKC